MLVFVRSMLDSFLDGLLNVMSLSKFELEFETEKGHWKFNPLKKLIASVGQSLRWSLKSSHFVVRLNRCLCLTRPDMNIRFMVER